MSVAPTWRDLPSHRIPPRLRIQAPDAAGSNNDACWRLGEGPFEVGQIGDDLVLRPYRPTHGLIEPAEVMALERFQAALVETREQWVIDEE